MGGGLAIIYGEKEYPEHVLGFCKNDHSHSKSKYLAMVVLDFRQHTFEQQFGCAVANNNIFQPSAGWVLVISSYHTI
jgi:hypothetical protein